MDIIRLPIEYNAETVDSRFRLVLITAQRARQLSEGSPVLVKSKYVKNITKALDEAIECKLKYLTGEEARKARDYEYRIRREKMARESMEEAAAASLEKMDDIKEAYKADTTTIAVREELDDIDIEEGIVDEEEDLDAGLDEE
ncbi:MAG TPA: DNA-directed RNA polymerase subunit omega [Nitrospirota bacterium]